MTGWPLLAALAVAFLAGCTAGSFTTRAVMLRNFNGVLSEIERDQDRRLR